MPTVTAFPTTNAADVGAGLTNPNNAHANDGTNYATAAPGKNTTLGTRYGDFGFNNLIPVGARIVNVTIEYEWRASTINSIATGRIRASVVTTDTANNDDTSEPAADTIRTYDITSARNWRRADLLDGTFFIELHAVQGNSSTAVTFSFDYVSASVTWTGNPMGALGVG